MTTPERILSQTSDLKFNHLSTEQGLSQDIVSSITQDKQGFIWFATENGLNRYDGYSIKVYKHNQRDSTSLAINDVGKLFLDQSGTLWVFQSGVISKYDSECDAFTHIRVDFTIYCALDDRRSHLLLGTDRGLMTLGINNHSIDTLYSESNVGKVYSLCESASGFAWVGTSNWLYRYESGSGKIVRQEKVAVMDGISKLLEDSRGRLWYSTGQGLHRFNFASTTIDRFYPDPRDPKSLLAGVIFSLFEDRRGNIWVGTFSGLARYDTLSGGFIHYRSDPEDPYSLRSNRVYSVYQDRDGAMWIGTYRGGVSRSDPYHQKFEHYYNAKANSTGSVGTNVFAVLESASGELWVGTETGGMAHVDKDSHRFTSFLSDQRLGATTALEEDRKGRLWLGTQGTGLVCYDGRTGTIKRYRHSQTISSSIGEDDVQALHLDRDGILWVGLKARGLDRYDERTGSFTHYKPDDRYPNVGVWHIAEDHREVLWLGSFNGSGVYCFEKSTGAFTIPGKSLAGLGFYDIPSIRAVYEDSHGVLWLGSWGGGLYRFDPVKRTLTQFTEAEGLANNFVKGMLADDREKLWISTENGMSRLDPVTGTFKNFTTADGLQSNFFWSGSFCKGKNGRMYFGGTSGFNAFHPDSIKDNPNIPPIVITQFTVLNEPMRFGGASGSEIRLQYDQDFFSFEFVALNYTAPEKNEYAYRMEGFDKGWVKAGTRRYAAYTHLDPGQYTFRVKAANNDGIWNEQGASVSIIILPPYWKTWWFLLLVALTLAGGLTAAYVYRVRRLLEIERLRSRIAADLHDDVGSEIGHIALASQLLARKKMLPEKEQHQLLSIGTSALHASEMMKEVVWLLNPKNDSLQDILLKMKTAAAELLTGIDYTLEAPPGEFPGRVDLKIKRNIFLMYKEILHNIVKHAQATRVSIEVQIRPRYLGLTVSDNGTGFDTSAQTSGNGLGNLRNRAAQIGGNVSISSERGTGTTIALNVKI